jgi:hypothetical protein
MERRMEDVQYCTTKRVYVHAQHVGGFGVWDSDTDIFAKSFILMAMTVRTWLNTVQYYWGRAKKYARDNCGFSIDALRETVPKAVGSASAELIYKYYKKGMRILQAYKDGISYGMDEFVEKVYRSHRRTTEAAKDLELDS